MSQSSKSKVIVLTALQEGVSIGAVAKRFGVSRRWVHILLAPATAKVGWMPWRRIPLRPEATLMPSAMR